MCARQRQVYGPVDESLIKVNELPEPWTNLCDAHCQEGQRRMGDRWRRRRRMEGGHRVKFRV